MLVTDKNTLRSFAPENRLWQGIPGVEVTEKGRIFTVFYSGGHTEETGNYVILCYSDDGGKSFTDPAAVVYERGYRCFDASLWIDPGKRLWLFYTLSPTDMLYAAVCEDPDAETLLFREPRPIAKGILLNKPIIDESGTWLLPVACWRAGIRAPLGPLPDYPEHGAFVYASSDAGKTFVKRGAAHVPDSHFDEHMLLIKEDGQLACYVRTFYGIGIAYSEDGGYTFTEGADSGIPGPDSRFYIGRLSSGRVLLVNHFAFQGRNNLTLQLSEDDGRTFPYKFLLDPRDDVSYPDVKQTADGAIYVVHDHGRGAAYGEDLKRHETEAREILLSRVTEDDILAGALLSDGSFRCRPVSVLTHTDGRDPVLQSIEQPYFDENDCALLEKLDVRQLMTEGLAGSLKRLPRYPGLTETVLSYPEEGHAFIHEAAVISFHGVLYASWYENERLELQGVTPIIERRSFDGGKSWSEKQTIVTDESGQILFCPPVYCIANDRLYLFINEMVSADHMHALRLYRLNEETGDYELIWRRALPFKLNTNAVRLENGTLMLPGRLAELDGFPTTPGVLLQEDGDPEGEWRLVRIAEDGTLPDGASYVHPELSAITKDSYVMMFSRDDNRKVPLVYGSADNGEHWAKVQAHDIPFSDSKIYAGTLSDGRNYVIGNLYPGRSRLAIFFSKPGTVLFDTGYMLEDGVSAVLGYGVRWHYPCAYEADGKLYVICTVNVDEENRRGAVLLTLPL